MMDIARRVGVARSTVSAVLNNKHEALGINAETARRIREAADKLGYFRNEMAVAIKTGQNAVIGCLTIDLNREWVARVLTGLLQTTQEAGYLIKIINLHSSGDSIQSLQRLVRQRMAGIFCCDVHPPGDMARRFRELCARYRMPVVAINSADAVGGHHLRSDDIEGSDLAIGHLWKLGHRRIAHLMGDPDSMTGQLRRQGFLRAIRRRGGSVPKRFIAVGTYDSAQATLAARRLLQMTAPLPTAIFCANDEVAAAALQEARALGFDVPRDLSIIGYSNIKISELTAPPLTTVEQPFERMGERGARLLLDLIPRPQSSRLHIEFLSTRLVIRDTTAVPASV